MKKVRFFEGVFSKVRLRGGDVKKTGRNAGEIEEYDFFIAREKGGKGVVAAPAESANQSTKKNARDKGMTFFLWE